MEKVQAFIRSKEWLAMAVAVVGGVFLVATFVQAATTISTDVATAGNVYASSTVQATGAITGYSTLSVTGASALTGLATFANGYVSQASSTVVGAFTATGAGTLGSTLSVTGATTHIGALIASSTLQVTGALTTYGTNVFGGNTAVTGTWTGTSASANALAVGPAGATNPALNVDASTASSATGFNIKSAVAGGGLALSTISSGANENLTLDAKGTGTIGIGSVSTGRVTITPVTTITGLGTLAGGFLSTASSTVVGNLTVTGTLAPTITTLPSLTLSNTSNQLVLGTTNTVTLTSPAPAASRTYTIPDNATASVNFVLAPTSVTTTQALFATATAGAPAFRALALGDLPAQTGTGNIVLATSPTLATPTFTGLALFNGGASSTIFSSYGPSYFGATATSSFATNGALTLVNALTYGGVTLSNAVTGTGNMVLSASPTLTGTATLAGATLSGLASTTQLRVGNDNVSTVSGMIFGTCTLNAVTVTATSTAYTTCTGATGVTSSYTVFVQPGAPLPSGLILDAASSTATTGTLGLHITNATAGANTATGAAVVNFWAVR